MSPVQRSLKYLRAQGYQVAIVERFIRGRGFMCKQDAWGCVDLIAVKEDCPVLAVQTTTGDHLADRILKAGTFPFLWRSTGNEFAFHAWRKMGQRGKAKRWWVRIVNGVEDTDVCAS